MKLKHSDARWGTEDKREIMVKNGREGEQDEDGK